MALFIVHPIKMKRLATAVQSNCKGHFLSRFYKAGVAVNASGDAGLMFRVAEPAIKPELIKLWQQIDNIEIRAL